MHLDLVRELKATLRHDALAYVDADLAAAEEERPSGHEEGLALGGFVAVGLAARTDPDGARSYCLAVRHRLSAGLAEQVEARAHELAGDECDVRAVGRIRALQWTPEELQTRVRPLRPGLSVAHTAVTAGTIGTFVRPAGAPDDGPGQLLVLSNNHVLADSDRGNPGDVVLQPGPADGGSEAGGGAGAGDRIGTLDQAIALTTAEPNLVDAATAVLDDGIEVETAHPAGELGGVAAADLEQEVEKVGRTTGVTRGRVTAIELDGVAVEYPVGVVEFDDQVEVAGAAAAFSAGGDSGSLVYLPDTLEAVGLLFAGSESGGPDGTGLTYCNPIEAVLSRLGVTLAAP